MARPAKPSPRLLSLYEKKLASSALTPEDGAHLGMSLVESASSVDNQFHPVAALKIDYHDIDGAPTGFFRLRYLEDLPGFAGVVAKPQRYVQSQGTLNWVYLPRINGTNWPAIANDATVPLIITEGELKAACACKHGYVTLGLGGVTVWQSSKKQVPLLPPLDKFSWKGRQVTIVFDSDAATNPQVSLAQLRLARKLTDLGAAARIASLPADLHGQKQGLDDFIVADRDLSAVLRETRPIELGEHLANFNSRYAYVLEQDVVIDIASGLRSKRDSFINGLNANVKLVEFSTTTKGSTKKTDVLIPREWLGWPARRDVRSLVYEPGAERLTEAGDYNTWEGWGCGPAGGDLAPWHELLDYIFSESPADRAWFEQWLAYPLQHPGAKLYSGCLLWGSEHGTGKSLVGVVMGRIYGKNFTTVENADLFATFNEWAVNKQFILGDEVSGTDKRAESDKLKSLVTRPSVRINMKHLPTYEVADCINYYLTSNHADSLFLEDKDRRWFIHGMPSAVKPRQFYIDFMRWLDKNGGKEALFHHLLHVDLEGFDPGGPAPVTKSKLEMIYHSKSDVAAFAADLHHNTEEVMAKLQELFYLKEPPALVLNKHLLHVYDPEGKTRVTAIGMGRILASSGVKSITVQRSSVFGTQRFYILQDPGRWLSATPQALKEYVDRVYQPLAKKGTR